MRSLLLCELTISLLDTPSDADSYNRRYPIKVLYLHLVIVMCIYLVNAMLCRQIVTNTECVKSEACAVYSFIHLMTSL